MEFWLRVLIMVVGFLSGALYLSMKSTLKSRRVKDVHKRTRQQISLLLLEALEHFPEETRKEFLSREIEILEGHLKAIKEL